MRSGGVRYRKCCRNASAPPDPGMPSQSVLLTWQAPRSIFWVEVGAGLFRAGLSVRCTPMLYPYFHGRMFGDRSKIPAGSLAGYKAPLAIPGLFEHALSIVKTWAADLRELEEILPKLAPIPALLMWGTKDPAVDFSSMQPLARHFRNVQTVVFPGAGHLPYEECPGEFNQDADTISDTIALNPSNVGKSLKRSR